MMLLRAARILTIVIAATSLPGCFMSADTKSAEQAVATFHQMLDSGRPELIYAASADDMKQAASREEFVAYLAAVHRKLGNSHSSDKKNWSVAYKATGSFVVLVYTTAFDRGRAEEKFTYRLKDGRALLAGYRIYSTALVIN